ncbi:MAG: hypothetical protein Q4A79_02465 [Candidatus Saccharibacteria bacterium]|nr:hypothetical protein [Candidatus Saccharibacteria bacterium]
MPEKSSSDRTTFTSSRRDRPSITKTNRATQKKREGFKASPERTRAHQKIKKRQAIRTLAVLIGFALIAVALFYLGLAFLDKKVGDAEDILVTTNVSHVPTVEIIDEATSGITEANTITDRMKEFIGRAEADFRERGYSPTKVVVPSSSIREVDFYLDNYDGYLKLLIDRGASVSVEDADRMIKYLNSIGVYDFSYIDVRVEGKAYWRPR